MCDGSSKGREREELEQSAYVIGVGAANVDISGKSFQKMVPADSNPGEIGISAGGVTRNILDNVSRLGIPSKLIAAVGDDVFSNVIYRACEKAGIDTSYFVSVPGMSSSKYIDLIDSDGDMALAVSDMRVIRRLTPEKLEECSAVIRGARFIVADGGLPPETLDALVNQVAGDVPVLMDTVSTAYARNVKRVLGKLHIVKPNLLELGILSDMEIRSDRDIETACEIALNTGLKRIAVTLGEKGCYYADAAGVRLFRSLRVCTEVKNATGAGDAFTAGILFGICRSFSVEAMLDFAMGAGVAAILSEETINPEMNEELIDKILKQYK